MSTNKIEMVGKTFGRWTVIDESSKRDKTGAAYYFCKCSCGVIKEIRGTCLRYGSTTSCGCYNRELITKDNPKSKRKLYVTYQNMLDRCRNKNNKGYHNYGGRGIRVSEKWNTYEAFEMWSLEHGYKEGLWLDRINNDGDYSPDNCRWTTPKVQECNKRNNVFITINGEAKTISQWAEYAGIKQTTMRRRITMGWKDEKLISPVRSDYSHSNEIKKGLKKRRNKHDR